MTSGNRRWGFNGYNGYGNMYGVAQASSASSSDDFEGRFNFKSSSRFPNPPSFKKTQKTYPSKQPNRQSTKRGQPPAPPRQ
ncbi:WAS/WASL-interacting protein family member 2-like isoform X2 [Lytechinus pictus]|uniref:WAS/WASL-interacting protein family member 2-like isoform X2 n=1 Tax=Lytechinus pictus TaxID=7653 RepID=UPI00240D5B14|nr:WAS/WASL-interacting protein family member 2-like isoform X2 [Lytechinus pictus]